MNVNDDNNSTAVNDKIDCDVTSPHVTKMDDMDCERSIHTLISLFVNFQPTRGRFFDRKHGKAEDDYDNDDEDDDVGDGNDDDKFCG